MWCKTVKVTKNNIGKTINVYRTMIVDSIDYRHQPKLYKLWLHIPIEGVEHE
jgi:hypothetical protein